ncbi:MAG TPA: hypothetical protein VFC05_14695 [Nitrososphaeraceae archaeon]|jgi:hypothetical protein|nr:hypothetical protein [Nitrososphaeraceae archaeon]
MNLKSIKTIIQFAFSGFSLFFIAMLFFILVQETLTGDSSVTAEYCDKYGFLASRDCW